MSMPGCIDMQNVFLFLSVGLVAINLILMEFMQNTIEKEERIKIAVLTEQNQKNRIANYQDREEIYERQRRKMHDYKNQLSTIQTFIYAEADREHSCRDVGNQHKSSGGQCCFKPEVPQHAGETHSSDPKSRGSAGDLSGGGRDRDPALQFTG
jgi:hypothetical protein